MPKKLKNQVKTIIPNNHQRYCLQSVLQEFQQQQIDSLFTFEDGPENATEQPVNVHPFNTIVGAPPLAQIL